MINTRISPDYHEHASIIINFYLYNTLFQCLVK